MGQSSPFGVLRFSRWIRWAIFMKASSRALGSERYVLPGLPVGHPLSPACAPRPEWKRGRGVGGVACCPAGRNAGVGRLLLVAGVFPAEPPPPAGPADAGFPLGAAPPVEPPP